MKWSALAPLALCALACSSPSAPPTEKNPDKPAVPFMEKPAVPEAPKPEPKLVSVEKAKDGAYAYELATLDNGLTIITLEDHTAPVAAVQLWYHVGSKNEQPNRRGFAHMFEHMMFRGTQKLGPKDHFEYIRKTGGDANAYTAFDQTVYVQEVPANQVEMVFWLESERMAFLRIDEDGFSTERNVVAEEYRMGREAPYGNVPDDALAKLFPKHPYGWSPIGNLDELKASTSKELQSFWETYYVPNNATLVVVGDIKHAEVQELARRYFGWIPRYPDPPKAALTELPASMPAITLKATNGPAPVAGVVFRGVPSGHKDELALSLLGSILGGGESSRLNKTLVVEQRAAIAALSASLSLEDAGLFLAGAILSPVGSDLDKVSSGLQAEIDRLRTEGPTEQELLKARNNALRGAVEEQLAAAGKANRLGSALVLEKNLPSVNTRFDEIKAITVADLKRVAETYLAPEKATPLRVESSLAGALFSGLLGGSASQPASQPASDKAPATGPTGKPNLTRPAGFAEKPPLGAPLRDAKFPTPSEKVLENGLKVVFLEDHELPLVAASLQLPLGAVDDLKGAPGTAAMAAQMLTRGTKDFSYLALADELDTYAIQLAGSVSMDDASVDASALKDEAPRMMKLLAEAVQRPTFPQDQLDLLRSQAKTGKAIEENEPNYLADRELRRLLYGEHPYARTVDGTSKDLDAITAKGMKAWWASHARPDTAILYIAGDISEADALALATEHFGAWKATGTAPAPVLPALPEEKDTTIYLINRPGEQAQIRVGYRSISLDSPRYPEAKLVNQVLGGSFNSRLNDAIRVKRGLTYGAGGGISMSRFGGSMRINTFSKNATVGETVQVIIDELKRFNTEPPSADETSVAQTFLTGSFVLAREAPSAVLNDHWLITSAGLPADFFQKYLSTVGGATPGSLAEAARELVRADKLVIVVVGQADILKPQLEKIAPVVDVK